MEFKEHHEIQQHVFVDILFWWLKKINSWLNDLYEEDQIPHFEQTTENYQLLAKLKERHKEATLLTKSLIKEMVRNKSGTYFIASV